MLYRETDHVGEVMREKEYEGTPQEIAELINGLNKSENTLNVKLDASQFDIKQKTKELADEVKNSEIMKGIR